MAKNKRGAKVHKVYYAARMPHQRFLESEVLEEAKQQELAVTYYGLNTVILLEQVNLKQGSLRRRAKSRYKLLAWLG